MSKSDKEALELEDKMYDEQKEYLKKHKYNWRTANYGWFVDGHKNKIIICTKVYGVGVLVSTGDLKTKKIEHEWSKT